MPIHCARYRDKNVPFHCQIVPLSLGTNTTQNLDTSSQLTVLQLSVSENESLDIFELNSSRLQKEFCLSSNFGPRIVLHQEALITHFQFLLTWKRDLLENEQQNHAAIVCHQNSREIYSSMHRLIISCMHTKMKE